jgi:hypothetical protein
MPPARALRLRGGIRTHVPIGVAGVGVPTQHVIDPGTVILSAAGIGGSAGLEKGGHGA